MRLAGVARTFAFSPRLSSPAFACRALILVNCRKISSERNEHVLLA